MILISSLLYFFTVYLLTRLPKVERPAWWNCGALFPHGAAAVKKPHSPLIIGGWIMVTGVVIIALRFLDAESKTILEISFTLIQSLLVALAALSLVEASAAEKPVQRKASHGEVMASLVKSYPFVLLIGDPPEIMQLHTHPQLHQYLEETPYPHTRIAPAETLDLILETCPTIRYIPWAEEFQEKFVEPHATLIQSREDKITESMTSDALKDAACEENEELKQRLTAALTANRTLDGALHDMRRKGAIQMLDYAKMSSQQRKEEEKRLQESLRRLNDAEKIPKQPSLQPPAEGFQTEVRLGEE